MRMGGALLASASAIAALSAGTPHSVFGAALKVWHDVQDPSVIFTDFASTPAIAGSRVALLLDKSQWQGRTLAQELAQQAELRGNGVTDIVGTATAATYNPATGAGTIWRTADVFNQSYVAWPAMPVGHVYRAVIQNTGASTIRVRGGGYGAAAPAADIAAGQTLTVTIFVGSGGRLAITPVHNDSSCTFTVLSLKTIPGAHLYQPTTAQQPFLRQAANGAFYLECDGADDGMVTIGLDLTATDKIAVFTAVRKLSDAAAGTIVEFSTSVGANNGSFRIAAPPAASSSYDFYSRGMAAVGPAYTNASVAAPVTNVIAGLADISGDNATLRVNGEPVAHSAADQGAGNFGNFPLYYFRRAGSSLPFNGHFYGDMIVAGIPSPAQIAWAENHFNRIAGAY